VAALALLAAGEARSETWNATTEKAPNVRGSCPQLTLTYELTVDGRELAAKTTGGQVYRGEVASDGTASLRYAGPSAAIGQITISGNVRTKQLQMFSSVAPHCIYTLRPGAGAAPTVAESAYQGTVGDWALGRWKGMLTANVGGIGLQSLVRVLIIEKTPDGRVGCRFTDPAYADHAPWVDHCSITANTITMRTRANSSITLGRSAPNRLEGRSRGADTTSHTVFLER
jgi:hypothetical protein